VSQSWPTSASWRSRTTTSPATITSRTALPRGQRSSGSRTRSVHGAGAQIQHDESAGAPRRSARAVPERLPVNFALQRRGSDQRDRRRRCLRRR
jgi:hypothetical protein